MDRRHFPIAIGIDLTDDDKVGIAADDTSHFGRVAAQHPPFRPVADTRQFHRPAEEAGGFIGVFLRRAPLDGDDVFTQLASDIA